jgi:hypothetical protein
MYADPGSGLLFLQIIVAAALTVVYRFRRFVTAMFTRKSRRD